MGDTHFNYLNICMAHNEDCNYKFMVKNYCKFHYQRLRRNIPFNQPKKIEVKNKICSVENCNRKHHGKGLCKFHYKRQSKNIPLDLPFLVTKNRKCQIINCERKHFGLGYCKLHYTRIKSNKNLNDPIQIKDGNQGCKIENCQGKHEGLGYCRKHYERIVNPRSRNKNDLYLEVSMNLVRKRDKNTCKWYNCGKTSKISRIDVHHIFPQSEYPELKYIQEYMLCYCKEHHAIWHKYRGDKYYKLILN